MDSNILCTLLAQRIPPEQFQLHGLEVVFFDPEQSLKPVGSPNESPYDTAENRKIVKDVIEAYDDLAVDVIAKNEEILVCEEKIKAKIRSMAINELKKGGELPPDFKERK